MNIIKKYFWQILVVILVFALFLQQSCNGDKTNKDTSVIITKPKVGGFDYYKPKPIKGIGYIFVTNKGDTIKIENLVNKELEQKYLNALSENEKLKLYLEAIQKRTYMDSLENKDIKFKYTALTTGTLDSIKFDYVIKSDTIKIKQPVFRLLAGPSLEFNYLTMKPSIGINVGFQNKKGNIFTGGINSSQQITIGYYHNLWTYKK
jgi:hypothetical protein